MTMSLVLTFISVITIGFGQVLFKAASSRIDSANLVTSVIFNVPLIAALAIYAFSTMAWVFALRGAPLNRLYPFFALAFIFVPIIESLMLSVALRPSSLIGGAIIAVGVFVAVR